MVDNDIRDIEQVGEFMARYYTDAKGLLKDISGGKRK
jgi:hypothetical protein